MSDERAVNRQTDLQIGTSDAADSGAASISGSDPVSSALGSNRADLEIADIPSTSSGGGDRPWNFEQIDSALEVSNGSYWATFNVHNIFTTVTFWWWFPLQQNNTTRNIKSSC